MMSVDRNEIYLFHLYFFTTMVIDNISYYSRLQALGVKPNFLGNFILLITVKRYVAYVYPAIKRNPKVNISRS